MHSYDFWVRVVYDDCGPLLSPLVDYTEAEAMDRLAEAVRQHPRADRVELWCRDGRVVNGRTLAAPQGEPHK